MKRFLLLIALTLVTPLLAQDDVKHATGYVPSPFAKALKASSAARHSDMLKKLADAPLPAAYETPFQIPQRDQGNCGSCWDVSACRAISCAFVAAGQAKGDGSFNVAPDAVMWCYSTGGCNGDDASTVMRIAKKDGLPIEADFGEYKATGRGPCNKTAKRYKIDDWGYADADGDGVTTYAEIKAVIFKYGAVVITVNAGGLVNGEKVSTSFGGGTNHQIIAVGWDDTKGDHGAVLCVNQWGSWGFEHNGQKGFTWLGVNDSGHIAASGSSEVIWCKVDGTSPPTPPGPTPPVPPVPPAPVETVTFTIPAQVIKVPGYWGSTNVTIPAQTITAPITHKSGDCPDCEPVVIPVAPPKAKAPQPVQQQSQPRRRRFFR